MMRMAYLWVLQLFTGAVILVLSVIHLISVHIHVIEDHFGIEAPDPAGRTWQADHWAGIIVFLSAIILLHALVGLRQTALELAPSVRKGRAFTWAIIAAGAILFISAAGLPAILSAK